MGALGVLSTEHVFVNRSGGFVTFPLGAMTTPRTQYAHSGDASIAYQVLGDGPLNLAVVNGPASHLGLIWEEPATSRSPLPARRPVVPASATTSRVEASRQLSGDRRETDIRFARFLIKAGLSSLGVELLQKIIKESPGTQAARDAQKLLDSIAKTK